MAYGGRKTFGNDLQRNNIQRPSTSNMLPSPFSPALNAFNQPLLGTSVQNSPFMNNRLHGSQLLGNHLGQQAYNSVQRLIAVRGNRNNQSNKHPIGNIHFNNAPSTSHKKNSSQNLKRSHASSADIEAEIDSKRQKSLNGEANTASTGGKYALLTEQVESYAHLHAQSDELLDKKLKLRSVLLCMIQKKFPGVSLHLVGSSCNGFASDTSDADFCIMITHKRNVNQRHEARFYLKTVENLIRQIRSLRGMQFIPAKVPILKFKDVVSGCECDINVNNAVGIRNTHLLRTYSKVESRVQPMVMAIKRWGKSRKINDASQGTLSSYSLVLMILHYLQHGCKPPVLQSLQQKYPQYFRIDSNVDELPMSEPANMMPHDSSNNKQSVGQLIEGFFKYFAEFAWDNKIMSVRLGSFIPKKGQREFRDKFISIEEPFEMSNTARAVHEMSKFVTIKKEFQRAHQRLKEQLSFDYIA